MKHSCIFLFFLLCFFQPAFSVAQPVRFAPLPMHDESYVRREFYPFIQHLEKVLQRPVQFAYHHNNIEVVEGLMSDTIDLAFIGPMPYAILFQKDPEIIPLLQFLNGDGSHGYTCSIGVFAAEKLTITDLKDKSFALTRPYSTCGFLMTESMLNQQGLSLTDNHYEFIGKHPECALAVIEGQVDACGIKTSIGKRFTSMGLVLIEESPRVPGFVLVANQRTLSQPEIERVSEGLLALKPLEDPKDAEITSNWGRLIKHGTTPIARDDFKTIIELLNQMEIPGVEK